MCKTSVELYTFIHKQFKRKEILDKCFPLFCMNKKYAEGLLDILNIIK